MNVEKDAKGCPFLVQSQPATYYALIREQGTTASSLIDI